MSNDINLLRGHSDVGHRAVLGDMPNFLALVTLFGRVVPGSRGGEAVASEVVVAVAAAIM